MRLSRLVKLAVAAGMVAAVIPAAAAAAPDATPAGPRTDNPVAVGEVGAERALEAVQAAFDQRQERSSQRPSATGPRGGELTQELLQLRLGLDELSPEDQETALGYLARPTDGGDIYYGASYGKDARPTHDCRPRLRTPGSDVCVHWARRTGDAPPLADKDGNRVPDQVDRTRETMNHVWKRVVDRGLYKAPLADRKGPDEKLDVYLANIGGSGLYGYCSSENVGQGRAAAAYCVLDDDYAKTQFSSNSPLENLQVTAAHEFFHAVQFAYDFREDSWLMESTATWLEDEIFDSVNDNRYYLSHSALRAPRRPLDTTSGSFFYGNWIWWRYLTERFPHQDDTGLPTLVREVWKHAAGSTYDGTYSMKALARELSNRGHRLPQVFAEFSSQNRLPNDPTTGIYGEGKAYKKAPLSTRHRLTAARPRVSKQTPSLAHLTSTTVAFVPRSGYAGADWKLRVNVNLPNRSREPFAQLTTFRRDGGVERKFVELTDRGAGRIRAPFSSGEVKRIELTLTNGNHSYDCFEGTQWACRGVPDKKRTFAYWATSVR